MWTVLAGLALWLALAASTAAQEPTPLRQVIVPRGGTISMKMSSRKPITGAETDVQGIITVTLDKNDLTTALVRGDSPGIARLTLTDKDGGRELYDLIVQTDVEYLKYVLRRAVPTANVEPVPSANNAFVLTGTVARAEDVAIVLATAQSIIGNNIINALVVGGVQQVQAGRDHRPGRSQPGRVTSASASSRAATRYFLSSTVWRPRQRHEQFADHSRPWSMPPLSGTPNIISGILTSSNGFTGYLNALKTEASPRPWPSRNSLALDAAAGPRLSLAASRRCRPSRPVRPAAVRCPASTSCRSAPRCASCPSSRATA